MNAINSDKLFETLIQRTIGEDSVLTMGALLAAAIPAGITRYVRAEIIQRLSQDLSHAPHFARTAPPTAGPDAVRDALLAHAAEQYIFPREEFLELLENAARFTENYLCRPRWTLASFLFLDQPAITAENLLRKLEFLTEYAYLPQLLRRVVTHSRKQVITSGECASYVMRIDEAVIREHSPRERALLARPIWQFYLLSPAVENSPIPLRPLLVFLDDKQLTKLREHVEGVWHVRNRTEITLEDFIAVNEDFATGRSSFAELAPVQDVMPEPESTQAPDSTIPPAPIEPVPSEPAPVEPVPPEPSPPEPASPEPSSPGHALQEQAPSEHAPPELTFPGETLPAPGPMAPELRAEEVVNTPVAEAIPPEALPVPDLPGYAEPVAAEEPAVRPDPPPAQNMPPVQESLPFAEPAPAEQRAQNIPSVPSLQDVISDDWRRRFIHVICGKDAEFYDLVIARLDEMSSWPEASAYIRELFEINSIDPFDETAIAFTDVVQQKCDASRTAGK